MRIKFFMRALLLLTLSLAESYGAQDQPAARQTYYAVLPARGPNWSPPGTPEGAQIQQAHVANIRRLTEAGKLILAGPFTDDGQSQGLLIFKVDTQKEAEDLIRADPGVQARRFTAEVHPWLGPKNINTDQTPAAIIPPAEHVLLAQDQIKFSPGPPSLPPGAQVSLLSGDPTKAGVPFTLRAKFPDGYRIPPHWHPNDENIVVLQGTLMSALGEKFDQAAGHPLSAGSYGLMPKKVPHFSWAKGETVVQMYGVGPFEVNYVNPADDPRRQ